MEGRGKAEERPGEEVEGIKELEGKVKVSKGKRWRGVVNFGPPPSTSN